MGSTKRIGYSAKRKSLSNLFKALGHPARISILELLLQNERHNCSEIANVIPLSLSTISRHLAVMFESGLLGAEVECNNTFYTINPIALHELRSYLDQKCERNEELGFNYSKVYFGHQNVSLS